MPKTAAKPFTPAQERFGTTVIGLMSAANVWLYRLTGGWLGGRFPGGAPVCLVTVRGRKSGQLRTVPLLYLERGSDIVIVASKGGMPTNPDWYHNLLANPEVTVELGAETFKARATPVTDGPERDRLYAKMVEVMPGFADYEAKTTRKIPVVLLDRVS